MTPPTSPDPPSWSTAAQWPWTFSSSTTTRSQPPPLPSRRRNRAIRSVRQQWHRPSLVAAEQHGPRDRRRAEPPAHLVERLVEGAVAVAVEREGELDGVGVLEVGD